MREDKETPEMEARSHSSRFLKKAARLSSKRKTVKRKTKKRKLHRATKRRAGSRQP
jgi:t-SNARE complex subunit (syntaxin)